MKVAQTVNAKNWLYHNGFYTCGNCHARLEISSQDLIPNKYGSYDAGCPCCKQDFVVYEFGVPEVVRQEITERVKKEKAERRINNPNLWDKMVTYFSGK